MIAPASAAPAPTATAPVLPRREEQVAAWKEYSLQPVEVRIFPGGHFYVNKSRPAVLAALAAAVRRVMGR